MRTSHYRSGVPAKSGRHWISVLRRFTLVTCLMLLLGNEAFVSHAVSQVAGSGDDKPAAGERQAAGHNQPAGADAAPEIAGQFITISGSLDDVEFGRISRSALALQNLSANSPQPGVLVLQLEPGTSGNHHIENLAKFLTSELPNVTTVAWVPRSLHGNHVLLAMACQEIVAHPDAEIGDIGLGADADAELQAFALRMVGRRHNPRVNESLATAMMSPTSELLQVQVELPGAGKPLLEERLVLAPELDQILRNKGVVLKQEVIKPQGVPGLFAAKRARAGNFLVAGIASSRDEVAARYRLPVEAMREQTVAAGAAKAMIVRINGGIDRLTEQFTKRQIDQAVAAGVNIVVLEIDSDSGEYDPSIGLAYKIAEDRGGKVRTVAWIPRGATGPAALLALCCDEVYMPREARIGEIHPIDLVDDGPPAGGPPPGEVPQRAARRRDNRHDALVAAARELAERKNRSPALVEAMCSPGVKVYQVKSKESGAVRYMTDDDVIAAGDAWERGQLIAESVPGAKQPGVGSSRLLLTGARSAELQLVDPPVESFDDLKQRLGVAPKSMVPVVQPSWVDKLVIVLNGTAASVVLIILAIFCAYFELHLPIGLFGICSVLCLALFFWARFLGGTAGWLEVVLFLVGAGCMALEVFVLPGFGVFGVSGAALMLLSIVMATQTFVIPATTQDFDRLGSVVFQLGGGLAGVVVVLAIISRFLPEMPWMKGMVLRPDDADPNEPQLRALATPSHAGETLDRLIGRHGMTETLLRPAGKARIDEDLVDVVSEGNYVNAGVRVEVVSVDGTSIVVRPIG